MKSFLRMGRLSTTILVAFVGTLWLKNAIVKGSSECSNYDFPCEDGECIDSGLWCDSHKDCTDGSDEKYCKKNSLFNKNPNRCPSTYFKCDNGICIPNIGRCDEYDNCGDNSDENNCHNDVSSSISSQVTTPFSVTDMLTTSQTAVLSSASAVEGINALRLFVSLNSSQDSVQLEQLQAFNPSEVSKQRQQARNWLLFQRRENFGWDVDTARAIIALYLDQQHVAKSSDDMLMVKQLEIHLSLELARNETKTIKLADLALYINAFLVICKNSKNFYGENLVSILRDKVNTAKAEGAFINPFIYYTLCLNNATTNDDANKIQDIILSSNATINKIDLQAMALLTSVCIFKRTNFLNASMYDSIKMEFLRKVKVHSFPGNVHEATLLFQALQEMKVTLSGLRKFILKQQQTDGSFGDILSTYLVLPILSGRNLLQTSNSCGQRNTSNLISLEDLKYFKGKKMLVQYSLNYGFSSEEITQTIQFPVGEGTNFLNIMRLAQEINPKYRFKLNENREVPTVYSIGEIPNDVEKGFYWTLYTASINNSERTEKTDWIPHVGDIRQLILSEGDKALFWHRPL